MPKKQPQKILLDMYNSGERDPEILKSVLPWNSKMVDKRFEEIIKKYDLKGISTVLPDTKTYNIIQIYKSGERDSDVFLSQIPGLSMEVLSSIKYKRGLSGLILNYKGDFYSEKLREKMCAWIFDGDDTEYDIEDFNEICEQFFAHVPEDKYKTKEWLDEYLTHDSLDNLTRREIKSIFMKSNNYKKGITENLNRIIQSFYHFLDKFIKEGKIKPKIEQKDDLFTPTEDFGGDMV